ncbi:hypothetical protein [Thalassospira povalilytica]|uniref:hypothetical protein n=1 Tax=Thalassospira povalilytica TaxID=732237 RepID=UPI003AA7B9DB
MEPNDDKTNSNTDQVSVTEPWVDSEPKPTSDDTTSPPQEIEAENRSTLVFEIEVSRRYNLRMARGFKRLGQITRLVTIIGGSTAFVGLLVEAQKFDPKIGLLGTLALTVATALDIVFGYDSLSFEHRKHAKDYTDLLRRFKIGDDPKEIREQYYLIEANEQAPFGPALNSSHNHALKNLGYDDKQYKDLAVNISWWKKPALIIF